MEALNLDVAPDPHALAADLMDPPGGGVERFYDDPVGFVRECIRWDEGQGPTPYQEDVMQSLLESRRLAVRGAHGLGKTAMNSWLILWYALTRDARGEGWKIVTTASSWVQVETYLWGTEMREWVPRLRWAEIGRSPFTAAELMRNKLRLNHGEAVGMACEDPAKIEGAHSPNLLFVYDESKTIPDRTFDATEGAFSAAGEHTGQRAYAIATSTPGEPMGRFYDMHMGLPGLEDWAKRHVTVDEMIACHRLDPEWVEQKRVYYGEDSAWFQNRVLGEFSSGEADGLIRLSWVEAAMDRWPDWASEGVTPPAKMGRHWYMVRRGSPPDPERMYAIRLDHDETLRKQLSCLGVDVAVTGGDRTVIAMRYGNAIGEIRRVPRGELPQTTGHIATALQGTEGHPPAIVDSIGVGEGVPAYLRGMGFPSIAFKSSFKTNLRDERKEVEFERQRDAAYWHMRDLLDPSLGHNIALPPDEELRADLVAARWEFANNGKVKVEGKPQIRARLGRSPDVGDAVVMAFWLGAQIMPSAPKILRRTSRWAPMREQASAGGGTFG